MLRRPLWIIEGIDLYLLQSLLHWRWNSRLLWWSHQGFFPFLHLQIHPPIAGHLLPGGAVALHVVVLWLFPHFSWRGCTTASCYLCSCLTGRWWELMLLGKVCFVKSVLQPIGNILREFQIKDNSSSHFSFGSKKERRLPLAKSEDRIKKRRKLIMSA